MPRKAIKRRIGETVAILKRAAAAASLAPDNRRSPSELRALTLFESLPPGHATFAVTEDGAAPHLRQGEFAVVAVTDRTLQHGELYIIQYESGARRRCIVQVRSDKLNVTGPGAKPSLVWWRGDIRGFRKTSEVAFGCPVFAGLSDGPYQTARLQSKLIGRIVGVAFSHLRAVIAPEAGYENEGASNAAFDPAEYVDTLIATGHGPGIWRGMYCEKMPDRRLTKAENAAVFAMRMKYGAASTALDRVKQECIRRGLVSDRRAA